MKKPLGLLALFSLCLTLSVEAMEQRIRLKFFEGTVKIYQRKFDKWVEPEEKMALNFGDRIKTGEASKAVATFNEENQLLVEENSELELKSPPGKKSRIVLFFGNLFARFNKVMDGGDFEVETSDVVAGVKGTELAVGVSKEGGSRFACTHHSTYVIDRNNNQRFTLAQNRQFRYKIGEKNRYSNFSSKELVGDWTSSFRSYYNKVAESIREDSAILPQQIVTITTVNRPHQAVNLQEALEQLARYEEELDREFASFNQLFAEERNGVRNDRRIRNTVRILASFRTIEKIFDKTRRFYQGIIRLVGADEVDPYFKEFKMRVRNIENKFRRSAATFENLRQRSGEIEDQLNLLNQGKPVR